MPPAQAATIQGKIQQDVAHKFVTLRDGGGNLALRLNYDGQCVVDQVTVRGRQVVALAGVSSGIRVGGQWYTTGRDIATPHIVVGKNTLTVNDIAFSKPGSEIRETWLFTVRADGIGWRIMRSYPQEATLEDAAFPRWNFSSMAMWTGEFWGMAA